MKKNLILLFAAVAGLAAFVFWSQNPTEKSELPAAVKAPAPVNKILTAAPLPPLRQYPAIEEKAIEAPKPAQEKPAEIKSAPAEKLEVPVSPQVPVVEKKYPGTPNADAPKTEPIKKEELPQATQPLSAPAGKDIDISIEPSTIRLTGKPGESLEAKIRVYNSGTKDMKVTTEINDMTNEVGKDGILTRAYVSAGSSKSSLGKWILLNDKEFIVPSKSVKEIPFVVSPPADMQGGASGVIFFVGTGVTKDEGKNTSGKPRTTITIQPRLGALVFFESEGTVKRSGRLVGDIRYEAPSADQPLKISYEFANEGNSDILVTGTFHVMDMDNALVAKENLNPIRTFPGDKGRSETQWSGELEPGTYHVIVSLELGPDAQETIVREHDLVVN